ncbi:hypothetical protein SAMN06265365_101307 [Tistlia consotensis]|uniref:Uncharacterized protein n=1 Tax=Tistlia consotensis USBA 355 TaxID=560819 RepID=A0A1Y6B8R4_9PROT|nr:hypothetical protein [Tistlia consotensis]SME90371.1 hypothetical protein SAMN05428998_101305 [Tistlia consotensis USBA 355]SNR26677.1 hypothetical protein SAMN06265365_101307 [Tistlia consotensis]
MIEDDKILEAYPVREVVARFEEARAFEDAVDLVERHGVDRAAVSMMASREAVQQKLGHRFRLSSELEDEPAVPQSVFSNRYEIAEAKGAAIGLPVYIGGAGAGLAVFASGGTLAFAAVIAAAGAAAGAGIGALLSRAISKRHAEHLEEQLAEGGLLLWVRVGDEAQERQVVDLLTSAGGRDVRAHSITRYWGSDDIPLHDFNPDPWLGREAE